MQTPRTNNASGLWALGLPSDVTRKVENYVPPPPSLEDEHNNLYKQRMKREKLNPTGGNKSKNKTN